MKKALLAVLVLAVLACVSVAEAAPASLRMLTQNNYMPGLPVLVRVEGYAPDGSRDRETWNIDATLTADAGVTLSTNVLTLRNGVGSTLVTFSGSGNFNLTATVGGVSVTRALRTVLGSGITKVGGTLSGGSSTWSGVIVVTNDLIITNHVLTIQSNTLVLLDGVASGTVGVDIIVNANGSIQSLGTELHPVTITCSNATFANRWGQILHNSSLPSLYRHTFIHRAGRAPGEGHTSQAAAIRSAGSTLTFESCTISDLAETSSASPNYGTPAKVMFALSSSLSFNDCLFQRVRTGPEIDGTALLFTNSYVIEARGPDDSDGLYVHAQQAGQTVKVTDSVFAMGDDDGIDTLGPIMSVENCIFREWNNLNEDAKGISVFDAITDVRHCLFTDCTVAIAAKTTSSVRVNINNSTFMGNLTNVLAAFKANAPGPTVELRITNSIIWGGNPVHSDFDNNINPSNSTNFIIRYCDVGETWSGVGNINSDPLFVNAAAKNFRVQFGSPVINAGNPASPPDVDGTVADMGYFPFLTNASPLIAFGSSWRYLDNGTDQGTNWQARIFNDGSWSNGLAQLGYGDSDEVTRVEDNATPGYNLSDTDRYITTYFRRAFTVLNPSEFTNLEARILVDDGAVVYLNGQEVFRPNMPLGFIGSQTQAVVSGENSLFTNSISPSLLLVGTNVIAVEVHQITNSSTDISFDFELRGQRGAVPLGPVAPVVSITSPADGSGFISPATIPITVTATDADGTVTNVQFFQNGSLLWQTNSGPYNFTWQNVANGSYALTAIARDNSGLSATSTVVNVSVSSQSAFVTNTLIFFGQTWRYHDKGIDLGTNWRQFAYTNEASWSNGPAQLGYSSGPAENDEATFLSFGPDANNKYITYYFRRAFTVAGAASYSNLNLTLLRDDAGVVYLNGTEIFRSPNLPSGAIGYGTLATATGENTIDISNNIPATLLLEGTNVLAVEIHQQALTSSDVSFDLNLTGVALSATNFRPLITITNPAEGTIFGTPASFVMGASASDSDGTVTNVAFYSNGSKLGDDATSPFSFSYSPAVGSYALAAVATDNVGQSTTSSVVNITVSANVAAPVIASKIPAPGSVTSLTNIAVTFSKAVAGVNASDLLINGTPAGGVSGSGSNYTFTFSQPGFGVVAITWANAHGITDLFTPAHAFDTNSAGANWQYQLLDAVPPTIISITPTPSATVAALNSISVTFNESVSGVNASDLLVNSSPATNVTGSGAGPFVFSFSSPGQGAVSVDWAGAHGIQDLSGNPFSPVPWSYTLDTNSVGLVISEIMYHPSSENPSEEYIELFNKGAGAVNLNGWRFSSGVSFTFSNASIAAGGYLVVAANYSVFTNKYPGVTNVVGGWTGTLNNTGEDIDLDDAGGNRVDSVHYASDGDWAVRQRGPLDLGHRGWVWFKPHDGGGKSLELINPDVSNNSGQNWAASTVTNGTPGQVNSVSTNNIAPLILNVTHFPIIPRSTDQVVISARITDEATSGFSVNLFWRVDGSPSFTLLAMHDDGVNGDAVGGDGQWSAQLPVQANNAVVEFYVSATDIGGRNRTWPGAVIGAPDDGSGPTGQVANALFQVDNTTYSPTNAQPLYKMIMIANEESELQNINCTGPGNHPSSDAEMNGTFISLDGGGTELRYLAAFRRRGHGSRCVDPHNYHLGFRSDEPWKGITALNLNTVEVHIQHLGSVLARKAGLAGANSIAVQVRVNNVNRAVSGDPMYGSYAANEAQDGDFAAAHFPNDPGGNVYRAIRDLAPPDFSYRGENKNSYTNTYYKESNVSADDWTDLIGMSRVMGVGNTTPFTTANVRAVVNVEQWMHYLAVMSLFGNGETSLNSGFNDDYFMYAGVNDPRFLLTFYDLDTILGQGDTPRPSNDTIFSATINNGSGLAFDRFMHWPEFEPIYYQTLLDLLNTAFLPANFNATVDETLGGYVPVSVTDAIKSYNAARRAYVLSVIPAFTVSNAPTATLTGTPRSPTPITSATLTVGGTSVVSYQFSLNGGAYSAETLVATPISLSSLAGGTYTVAVIGKGANGVWQAAVNATLTSWVVNTTVPAVRINEVLARNVAALNHNGTFPDAIELFNEGAATVDIGGLRLSNDKDQPSKFTFPANTLLVPGSNLVVYANNVDGTPGFHLGFNLDGDGDSVHLFAAITNGGNELDSVKFGRQLTDLSIGRFGNSGEWKLTQPTFGGANVAQPQASPSSLRINEWLAVSQSQDDFIELYNPSSLPVALGGLFMTDNLLGDPARNKFDPLNFMAGSEFLALTANGNGNGSDHLNFHLSLEQGEIGLFAADLTAIDSVIYGPQQPDVSQGRCPNGGVSWTTLGVPTPGAPNSCPFVPPPPTTIGLLQMNDFWRYDASGNDLGTSWRGTNYNDSVWPQGRGVLGLDNGNNLLVQSLTNTVLPLTTTGGTMIITYYFRAHFNYPGGTTPSSLIFTNLMDDGVIVYLNEQEVYRLNMTTGAVNASTEASQNAESTSFTEVVVPLTNNFLRTGDNLVAVELHQFGTAPDLNMGLAINAVIVTNSPAAAGVVINEVFANNANVAEPDGSKPDWVEIYNPSSNAVDLADMSLTDATVTPRRWIFPVSTILNSHGFLKVRCDAGLPSSATNTGFGLKANGGSVFLFNRLADGGSLLSSVAYGLQAADFSIGRVPDGSSNWVLTLPTLGGVNIAAALGNPLLLKMNEWMANPASGDDYFEIFNPNVQPVDMSRFYLTDDLSARTKHQLPALSFIGVGQDAFQQFAADGNTTLGADHVNFSLKASGEDLGITSSSNVAIESLTFTNQAVGVSQGRLPDGAAAIVLFPTTPTPGKPNFLPINNVVVNEVLAHTDPPFEDAVEFYNPGATNVNIGGWYLSDSQNNLLKYRIPTNTIIPAHGYVVFYEYQFNNDLQAYPFSFSSAKGDEIYLAQSTNAGTVTGYRAFATFDASENGVSFGRFLTSVGADFTAMSAHTFGMDNPATTNEFRTGTGLTNAYPKVGPVVFNEIMYHPASTNDALEFIELRNITAAAVPLYDTNNPANTWRLRKGIDFNFPQSTTIPVGGYLVVVSFDPATDPVSLATFTSAYGTNMTLIGPYSGKLDNNGEALELQKPDAPQTIPGPDFGFVPYIVADRVVYGDSAPWPSSPDGTGDALKKITSSLYGNEPLNWQGGAPTPGAANFAVATNSPPALSAIVNRSVHIGYPVSFTASATDPDLPGQTLTFSLDGTPPSGATIVASNGTFNWTPATNQGPANYSFTVRVTDNGSPNLSDTKTFSIAVLSLPHVNSVKITNGMVTISWESYLNRRYRLETTTNLTNPIWTQVGSDVIASGNTSSLTVLGGTDAQRFYRVISFDN